MVNILDELIRKRDKLKRRIKRRAQEKQSGGTYQKGSRPSMNELRSRLKDLESKIRG